MRLLALVAAPATAAVVAIEPTRWYPLGYSVEAGSLSAGLFCCMAVRFWSSASAGSHRWTVDLPIAIIAALFTSAAIVTLDANLPAACMLGTGLAAIGEGLIKRAKKYADMWLGDQPSNSTGSPGDKPPV